MSCEPLRDWTLGVVMRVKGKVEAPIIKTVTRAGAFGHATDKLREFLTRTYAYLHERHSHHSKAVTQTYIKSLRVEVKYPSPAGSTTATAAGLNGLARGWIIERSLLPKSARNCESERQSSWNMFVRRMAYAQRSSKAVSGPMILTSGCSASVSLNSITWSASVQDGHSGEMVGNVWSFGSREIAVEKTAC